MSDTIKVRVDWREETDYSQTFTFPRDEWEAADEDQRLGMAVDAIVEEGDFMQSLVSVNERDVMHIKEAR